MDRRRALAEVKRTEFEASSGRVIGAAIAVHRELGPGFLESIYHKALCIALLNRQIAFETQRPVAVIFEGNEAGVHKLDLVVENELVVELKAVKTLGEVHEKQLRSYLKASSLKVGLLLNFNAVVLVIKRVVN
jgi:GxxExxY protein